MNMAISVRATGERPGVKKKQRDPISRTIEMLTLEGGRREGSGMCETQFGRKGSKKM